MASSNGHRIVAILPPASLEVAAAVVAALERFESDTGQIPAPPGPPPAAGVAWAALHGLADDAESLPGPSDGWARAALLEGLGRRSGGWAQDDAWRTRADGGQ